MSCANPQGRHNTLPAEWGLLPLSKWFVWKWKRIWQQMPSGGEVSRVGLLQLVLSESAARRVRANKTSFSAQSPITRPFAIRVTAEPQTIQKRDRMEKRLEERSRNCREKLWHPVNFFFFCQKWLWIIIIVIWRRENGKQKRGGERWKIASRGNLHSYYS